MLLIFLIIVAIAVAIYMAMEMCWSIPGIITASIGMSILTCFLALALFFLGGWLISAFGDVEYVEADTYDIVALKDNSTVGGHVHYLGSGHIDGKMQYVYLIKNENNKFEMKTIDAKYAELTTSNEVSPHVIVKKAHFTNDFMNFLLCDASIWHTDHYDIYVPEDTIDYAYNIDLE